MWLFIKTQVVVGGENCEVTEVKDEQITCTTPDKPQPTNQTLHMGGRGVLVEILTNESALWNETDSPCLYIRLVST